MYIAQPDPAPISMSIQYFKIFIYELILFPCSQEVDSTLNILVLSTSALSRLARVLRRCVPRCRVG